MESKTKIQRRKPKMTYIVGGKTLLIHQTNSTTHPKCS